MILALQIALAVAYALLAHGASAGGDARLALAALLVLVALVLAQPVLRLRPWALALAAVSSAAAWWLYRQGLATLPLLLVPVVFVALVAWVFGRSLQPGRVPLITRIVSGLDGVSPERLPADVAAYARRLTALWAGVLVLLGLANLVLALLASPGGLLAQVGIAPPWPITHEQWSWLANLLTYGVVGGFFVLEFQWRRHRFPERHQGFVGFLRRLGGLGPAFWRDFLR
ncbi:ketosynthase [Luteimonas viscosa]|uniref:Ketosynthase n=1 Tax=Luteimonas viscosa TaxID=1132694 RepID=A0A5D4XRW4_9GAMM|nr:ketosynthase [Luteimonas viscosa]TYT26814.1 ketosynthase [Luteimonas viscosa]